MKYMKKTRFLTALIFIGLITVAFLFSSTASAQETGYGLIPCGNSGQSRCTLCDLIKLAKNIIDFGLKALVIVALVGIAIGGVMYILAAGSETAITRAKGFLWSSIGGFAIVLSAWLIVSVVLFLISAKTDLGIHKENWYTFNVDCPK
jgi:hypothetical protein